jgi:hypothetical protein
LPKGNSIFEVYQRLLGNRRPEEPSGSPQPHPENELFSYRTHDGTEIPLVFKSQKGMVGIIPSEEKIPTLKARASAKVFLNVYPQSKVIITTSSASSETRDFKTLVIPYWWLI